MVLCQGFTSNKGCISLDTDHQITQILPDGSPISHIFDDKFKVNLISACLGSVERYGTTLIVLNMWPVGG